MSRLAQHARVIGPLLLVVLILVAYWILKTPQAVTSPASPPSARASTAKISPTVDAPAIHRESATKPGRDVTVHLTIHEPGGATPIEFAEACYIEASSAGDLRAWTATTDRDGLADLRISASSEDAAAAARYGSWLRGAPAVLLVHATNHVWHIDRTSSLATQPSASLSIELARGIQLCGVVKDASDSKPVASATLFVGGGNGIGDVYSDYDSFENATGSDGVFEIGLVEGKASALGDDQFDLIAMTRTGCAHFSVPSAETLDASLSIDRAHLSIDVIDEAGHPILVASAKAVPARGYGPIADAAMKSRYPSDLERAFLFRKSDGKGRIELEALPALTRAYRFSVTVAAVGYEMTTLDVKFEDSAREQTVKAVLKPTSGIAIHGVVRNRAGEPIEGAVIESKNARLPRVVTDAAGSYRLETQTLGSVPAWFCRVKKDGYVESNRDFDLSKRGSDVAIDFTLWKAAPISGIVVDSTGVAVVGASVALRLTEDAPIPRSVKSDTQGRFAFDPGGEGTWTIRVAKYGDGGPSGPTYYLTGFKGLVEGGTADYVIVLDRVECAASIDVEVVHGEKAEPVAVEAAFADRLGDVVFGGTFRGTKAILDGAHVHCDGIEAGRYRICAIAGTAFGSIEVDVPSATSTVKARLPIGVRGTIAGRIVGTSAPSGWKIWMTSNDFYVPTEGAWARLAIPNTIGILAQAFSVADGSFELKDVPVGSFRLQAFGAPGHLRESAFADVVVRSKQTTHVDIDMSTPRPSLISFSGEPFPDGVRVDLVVRGADGEKHTYSTYGGIAAGRGGFGASFELPPGEYSWTLEMTAQVGGGKKIEWRPRKAGKFVLGLGETKTIPLEFAPR